MDTTAFLRWLNDTMASKIASANKRIIRFQSRADYRRFIRKWSEMKQSLPPLNDVQQMPIIQAISCPLPMEAALPRFAERIWIEEDCRIDLHAVSQKPVASVSDKGIPWGVQQIKAPQAWSMTTGYRVKVGVIDTGIDFSHPDLRQSIARGINLLNRSMMPHDDNGHGTHIAGTIAAANQPHGMIGVAPRASIYPVKAFDHNGSAYVSDIILGIDWCVRNKMDIINMSFGMKTRSKSLLNAVLSAHHAGIVVVASSGNDSKRRTIDYPARYAQTISVSATTRFRRIAPFSNRGPFVDIYAPGDRIVSAWMGGRYHQMSGTSMATSHVSGAIALLLAYRPGLSPAEIKAVLRRSMQPLRGRIVPRNAGELDVMRMLQAVDRKR